MSVTDMWISFSRSLSREHRVPLNGVEEGGLGETWKVTQRTLERLPPHWHRCLKISVGPKRGTPKSAAGEMALFRPQDLTTFP